MMNNNNHQEVEEEEIVKYIERNESKSVDRQHQRRLDDKLPTISV